MNPEDRAQRRRRSLLFVGRLLVVYLVLFGLTRWFPTFFPRCVAALIPTWVHVLDSDYEVGDIGVDRQAIVMDAVSRKLEPLVTVQGGPGPSFSFNPDLQVEALNLYPVIVFTVLLAWPMPLRVRLMSLGFAVVLVPVACALDMAGIVLWWGGQWLSEAWLQVGNLIPATSENLAYFKTLEAHQEHVNWIEWAVSTSRPFIALLTALLSLGLGSAIVYWGHFQSAPQDEVQKVE